MRLIYTVGQQSSFHQRSTNNKEIIVNKIDLKQQFLPKFTFHFC